MKYLLVLLLLCPLPLSGDDDPPSMQHQLYSIKRIAPYKRGMEPVQHVGNPDEKVYDMIVRLADEYEVDSETALRIAQCESGFNPLAKNPNSSASGVYQFISSTWGIVGEGDVFDAEANIRAFMKTYPHYPSWWVCK